MPAKTKYFQLLALFLFLPAVCAAENLSLPKTAVEPIAGNEPMSVLTLITHSGPVVLGVLILLVFMSLITWAIVAGKWMQFRSAQKESDKFSEIFWGTLNLPEVNKTSIELKQSPLAALFKVGYKEIQGLAKAKSQDLTMLERTLKRARSTELTKLEKGTTFLATTASAAPFIGLFGTVWGIMSAFIGLSQATSTSIQAVAPGISEALIATAIGLVAAIPAAVGFNFFNRRIMVIAREMDSFSADLLNLVKKHVVQGKDGV